jgi:hypothetical protein
MKIRTETVHFVEYRDLEKAIKEHYGVDYEFVAAEECGNDSSHVFYVDGIIQDYDLEDLDTFLRGGWLNYRTGLILDKMHLDGHIPTGKYIVEVCW